MNLSHHSNDRLEEAFVLLDEPTAVAEVREWVEGLLARGKPVTPKWIARARTIYRPTSASKPRASAHKFLNLSGRVWLTHLSVENGEFGAATAHALTEERNVAGSLTVEAVDTTSVERSQVGDVWLVSFPGTQRDRPVSGNTMVRGLCVVRRVVRERGVRADIVVWAPPEQLASPKRLSTIRAHLGIDVRADTYRVPSSEVATLFDLLGVTRP